MVVAGFPPRGTHPQNLEVTNHLAMWAYTDLSDSRWKFTKKYLTLRQDPNNSNAQKLGSFNVDTWAAYFLNNDAFVKRSKADPAKTYPDFGCYFETFTNNEFLGDRNSGAFDYGATGAHGGTGGNSGGFTETSSPRLSPMRN